MKILAILCMLMVVASCSSKHKRVHVVPDGFRGWLLIFESRKDGYDPRIDSEVFLYLFDKHGVCKIRDNYANAWGRDTFIFQNGKLIESRPGAADEETAIRDRTQGKNVSGKSLVKFSLLFVGTSSELHEKMDEGEAKVLREMERESGQ